MKEILRKAMAENNNLKALLNSSVVRCTPLIATGGVRLLRDAAGEVRPLKHIVLKMAHPRPAESEHLQWKSTAKFNKDNLKVRSLIQADIPHLKKWLSDPKILKFYEGRDKPFDEEKIKHKFFRELGNEDKCLVLYENTPIGYIQYYELNDQSKSDYGYENDDRLFFGMDQFIGETDYWNKGVGTMLIQSMVDHIFSTHKADIIVMDPLEWNERAIHVYEKCGFKKVKELKQFAMHEGEWHDCLLIEMGRNDLNANTNN